MNVETVMTRSPRTCRRTDSLATATKILWDHDCGVVPVIDDGQRPVGMLTDRDCLMAAFTRSRKLEELSVQSAMAHMVFSVSKDQPVADAIDRMREHQVRRLPVVDGDGRLCGIVSFADLLRSAGPVLSEAQLARAAAAIMAPRATTGMPANEAKPMASGVAKPAMTKPSAPAAATSTATVESPKPAPMVVKPAKPAAGPLPVAATPKAAPAKPAAKKGKRS
jgi:CBS domain-containing protein